MGRLCPLGCTDILAATGGQPVGYAAGSPATVAIGRRGYPATFIGEDMKTETITVQVSIEIKYDPDQKGARQHIVKEATQLHLEMSGCGPTGCYSAKAIRGSGKEV